MKKLLCFLLAMLILIPSVAAAEYSPALGMTMREFITKYNQLPAALSSPYQLLTDPDRWTTGLTPSAYFYPLKDKTVMISLDTKDPDHPQTMDAGLDAVGIFISDNENWLSLLAVTKRCLSVFYKDEFNAYVPKVLFTLMEYYHDNCTEPYKNAYINFGLLNEYKVYMYDKFFYIEKAEN